MSDQVKNSWGTEMVASVDKSKAKLIAGDRVRLIGHTCEGRDVDGKTAVFRMIDIDGLAVVKLDSSESCAYIKPSQVRLRRFKPKRKAREWWLADDGTSAMFVYRTDAEARHHWPSGNVPIVPVREIMPKTAARAALPTSSEKRKCLTCGPTSGHSGPCRYE